MSASVRGSSAVTIEYGVGLALSILLLGYLLYALLNPERF